MAVETHGHAILGGVRSAFGLVNNMVALDLGAAKLVADATVPATCGKRLGFHRLRETHK